jgi:hypothetical protein
LTRRLIDEASRGEGILIRQLMKIAREDGVDDLERTVPCVVDG